MILEMTFRLRAGSGYPSTASWKKIFKCLSPKACCLLSFFFHYFIFLHYEYKRSYSRLTYMLLNLSTYLMKIRIKNFGKFAFLFIGLGCLAFFSTASHTISRSAYCWLTYSILTFIIFSYFYAFAGKFLSLLLSFEDELYGTKFEPLNFKKSWFVF